MRSVCLLWLVRVGTFHLQAPALLCAGISWWFHGIHQSEFSAASAARFRNLPSWSCPPSHGKLLCTVGNVPHQIRHCFEIPISLGYGAVTKVGR